MGKYAIRYIVQKSCISIHMYIYMKQTKYVVLIACHPERSL